MIERLQRALQHIEELSPAAQKDLAQFIEEQVSPLTDTLSERDALPRSSNDHLPKRIRVALAAIGSARDLQDDDEFAFFDRTRYAAH